MQIIAKKGVKIYRDFYIDMDIKPIFTPKTVKLPLDKVGQHIDFKKTIGDSVTKYEIIALNKNNIPIYSPVNGTFKQVAVGPQMGDISGMPLLMLRIIIPPHIHCGKPKQSIQKSSCSKLLKMQVL